MTVIPLIESIENKDKDQTKNNKEATPARISGIKGRGHQAVSKLWP